MRRRGLTWRGPLTPAEVDLVEIIDSSRGGPSQEFHRRLGLTWPGPSMPAGVDLVEIINGDGGGPGQEPQQRQDA